MFGVRRDREQLQLLFEKSKTTRIAVLVYVMRLNIGKTAHGYYYAAIG